MLSYRFYIALAEVLENLSPVSGPIRIHLITGNNLQHLIQLLNIYSNEKINHL